MMDKSAYMMRISQAGPAQLVVINFELILEFLTAARAVASASTTSEDMDDFRNHIQKAKNGLEQLIQSLNFETPLANDFYGLYDYAYRLLSDNHYTLDTAKALAATDEVMAMMTELLKGWREAASKTLDEAPWAGEIPKVYSGLTYGRDGQANEYVDDGKGRGFMA
ncbi:MAG: flagellar protein FliS [Defluviitaleaceae bacterium]|nr:flagellar protein FliS [Defluviitaleaceae bacterium]